MRRFEEQLLMGFSALINLAFYRSKPVDPRRILVIKPDHIGDFILAIPALAALKGQFPRSRITALVGEWCFPLTRCIPYLDDAISYRPVELSRDGRGSSFAELVRIFKRIRREGFDLAVDLRITRLSLALASARSFKWRADRSTQRLMAKLKGEASIWDHEVKRNLDALRSAGIDVSEPSIRLVPTAEGLKRTKRLLRKTGIIERKPIVVLHPGSPIELKRWPPEKFAQLADILARKLDFQVVLVGSISEQPISREVCVRSGVEIADLTGKTDLETLVGLLSLCELFIGNDSGPMHIAAALGKRTVGIFGPTSPERFGPYGPKAMALRAHVTCPPCMSDRCPFRPKGCIELVEIDDVLKAIESLLF